MERKDYRQLKEAFGQVQINEAYKAQEQQLWNEVQAYATDLVSEGYDLSEMTWDEVYEAYIEEGRLNGQQRAAARAERRAAQQAEREKRQAEYRAGGGDAGVAQRTGSGQRGSRARGGVRARREAEAAVREQGRKNLANKPADKPLKTIPDAKRPADMRRGVTYGDAGSNKPQPTKPQPQTTKPQAAKPQPTTQRPATTANRPSSSSITGNKASSFMSSGGSQANRAPKPSAPKAPMGRSAIKSNRLRSALDGVKNESAEFDLRFHKLLNQGFAYDDVIELMVHEATKHIDEKEEARKKRNKKINKVEMCPTIDESVLEVVFEEWIDEMVDDGYDLSECYESDLFESFLSQISEDAQTYLHLEYLGRISLEEASALSVEDQMRVSQAYFKKRNARSEEEKEAEKKRDARSRSKRSAMHSKPDPYKARQGESD